MPMTNKCKYCQQDIQEGENALEVHEGVAGARGFIVLDKGLLFCNTECLKKYFTSGSKDIVKLKRRVP